MKRVKANTIFEDIKKDNSTIDAVYTVPIKFENYEIEGNYIYGRGKQEKIDLDSIFKKNNKIDLVLDLLNIGKLIFNDTQIKKKYCDIYEFEGRTYIKPYISVDIDSLTAIANKKILDFCRKYGFIGKNKIDLSVFIRRILDFYCTVEIFNKVEENEISSIEENVIFILSSQYRVKEKNILCEGVGNNIQEKGILKSDEKSNFFDYFFYDSKEKVFKSYIVCNDYITLAYYQLSQFIITAKMEVSFRKCKICGEYINFNRSSKEYCDSIECQRERNKRRTRKSREKNKKGENNK